MYLTLPGLELATCAIRLFTAVVHQLYSFKCSDLKNNNKIHLHLPPITSGSTFSSDLSNFGLVDPPRDLPWLRVPFICSLFYKRQSFQHCIYCPIQLQSTGGSLITWSMMTSSSSKYFRCIIIIVAIFVHSSCFRISFGLQKMPK